jgi:succinyl-CoA synthetase beta subunit
VKVVRSLEDVVAASKASLAMQLVTHQTEPQGQKVQQLLIEQGSAIDRELYLGLVLDRGTAEVVFMASQSGGLEIKEVAHTTPELIYKEYIEPATRFEPYQARRFAFTLGLKPSQIAEAVRFMIGFYKAFIKTDSPTTGRPPIRLPLAISGSGEVSSDRPPYAR